MNKTLVIGSAIIDEICTIDKIPNSGEDATVFSQEILVGGCAFNVATNMKLIGCDVDLLAPIGTGVNGEIIKQTLKYYGLKPLSTIKDQDSGKCIVLVEKTGERTFLTLPALKKIDNKTLAKINWNSYINICIDGYRMQSVDDFYIIEQLKNAKNANIFFAPGPTINKIPKHNMDGVLKLKPIMHLNENEIKQFTKCMKIGDAIKKLSEMNKNDIFITLGKKGVSYYSYELRKTFDYNGEYVKKIINTNGAGDAHLSGIISFYEKGQNNEKACLSANRIAAKVVASFGTIIEAKEVQNVIEN